MKVPVCIGCGIELYPWVPAYTKNGKPYVCQPCGYSGKRAGKCMGAQDLRDELELAAAEYLFEGGE